MSEATDRPVDDDAWAKACAEDLEAEKARRRTQHGPPPGSAAEELRKLVDAVADKVAALQSPLFGVAAQGAVQQVIKQAKSVVEPVIERNPDVFDHIAAPAANSSPPTAPPSRARNVAGPRAPPTPAAPRRRPTTPPTRATAAPARASTSTWTDRHR